MATSRPRHLVTESDALAAALDAAAGRYPGVSRPQLLVRLALDGDLAARAAGAERVRHRLAVVERHAGSFTGAWTADDRPFDEEWADRDWPGTAGRE